MEGGTEEKEVEEEERELSCIVIAKRYALLGVVLLSRRKTLSWRESAGPRVGIRATLKDVRKSPAFLATANKTTDSPSHVA